MKNLPSPSMLDQLSVTRLQPQAPARAAVFSLPVPPGTGPVSVTDSLSQSAPIAWWPEAWCGEKSPAAPPAYPSAYPNGGEPRRQLVTLCADTELPQQISLQRTAQPCPEGWSGPTWEVRILEKNYLGVINWEVDELVLRQGDKELGLRVGLMTASGPMWWEWLRVEELWSGPACRAIRAAGYASVERLDENHPDIRGQRRSPRVHNQHWIFCEVYALLFANGVVHITARHVNNHLYDNGRDLNGVYPIIGLRGQLAEEIPLVGETVTADLGGVALSTEECRTLASAEHPGRLYPEGEVAILQPYQGVEVYLDGFGWAQDTPGYVVEAGQHRIPTGLARSVRFCLSFGEAPPRVERYVIPYYWYGLCAELIPDAVLPVSDFRDPVINAAGEWFKQAMLVGCFNDGSVPRGVSHYRQGRVAESGWEGETPYNLLRYYLRRPALDTWEAALRDVYCVADIAVDHATFMFRMHGYEFGAISPTMNRTLGLLQGYLETGDPYLRETLENVASNSFTMDTSNWPRRSFGRDAMYLRGLVVLEDYLPGRGYGVRAREGIGRAIACRRPEGCYTDQSGPGGCHGAGNMVIKPWMNLMLIEPMVDWLERHPEDEEVAATVKAVCDWLLAQLIPDEKGAYWPYESAWGDNPTPPLARGKDPQARHPWLQLRFAYPARPMLFATRFFGDPRYLQAWEENYRWLGGYEPEAGEHVPVGGDHTANQASEALSWHQLYRWLARWEDGRLHTDPCCLPGETCEATILTPAGPVKETAGEAL